MLPLRGAGSKFCQVKRGGGVLFQICRTRTTRDVGISKTLRIGGGGFKKTGRIETSQVGYKIEKRKEDDLWKIWM